MERECEDCGVTFTDKKRFNGALPKSAFCDLCCSERFFADIEHSRKNHKKEIWKFRSNWKAEVFNSSSLYEESSDFLHVGIKQEKLDLEIAVKKREGYDGEFLVWIGNKQFVCKAEPRDDEARHERGKVLSEHNPLDTMDNGI